MIKKNTDKGPEMMLSINKKLIFLVLLSFAAILSGKAYYLI